MNVTGVYADLVPWPAAAAATRVVNGSAGYVARCERQLGNGSAVLLNYEAAKIAFAEQQHGGGGGGGAVSADLAALLAPAGGIARVAASAVERDAALARGDALPFALRRAAPAAEHWFLLNEAPRRHTVAITVAAGRGVTDAVTGEHVACGPDGVCAVDVDAKHGRWVRAAA